MDGHGTIRAGAHEFWPILEAPRPSPQAIPVYKSLRMMQAIVELVAQERPTRIVEVGIYAGGSTALLAALAPEATLLGIELDPGPASQLARFEELGGSVAGVRVAYGVDQGDRHTVQALVRETFGDEPIDLVIDDASHQLELSRSTLDALLPFVRSGGSYVIEDWGWGQLRESMWASTLAGTEWPPGEPMAALIFDLVMAVAASEGVVDDLVVAPSTVIARRGVAPLDPDGFRLRDQLPGAQDYQAP
ncbi:MAG: class I SAM-dependent methyltransferase [Acidimicrobiales bacterium]|nr:class I SAM-dependent methyltransferase [Acidimicrobiales bacterium]HRW38249.1 CmcI family methyltransferase [Aquihabitans sp.]